MKRKIQKIKDNFWNFSSLKGSWKIYTVVLYDSSTIWIGNSYNNVLYTKITHGHGLIMYTKKISLCEVTNMITKFCLKIDEFQSIMSQCINIWNIIACMCSPLKCTQCTQKKKFNNAKKYLIFEPYSKILFEWIVF